MRMIVMTVWAYLVLFGCGAQPYEPPPVEKAVSDASASVEGDIEEGGSKDRVNANDASVAEWQTGKLAWVGPETSACAFWGQACSTTVRCCAGAGSCMTVAAGKKKCCFAVVQGHCQ